MKRKIYRRLFRKQFFVMDVFIFIFSENSISFNFLSEM